MSSQAPDMPTPEARYFVSFLLWPLLFACAVTGTWYGIRTGNGILWFNFVYVVFALTIGVLERVFPHETAWLENDRQTFANLAHTLLNKGLVQVIVVVSGTVGLADFLNDGSRSGIWPDHWPMVLQVVLGLTVAEFGLYWAHRLSHEIPLLWRFHAVHHSVTRLWFVNTGRFHFVDTFFSILLSQPLLYLAGAPTIVFLWVSAVTAFIGMLTHCNIEMRFGVLSYMFNTPALHRWHHSKKLREGNTNYGENLMLWDLLFRTFFNPDRRPPVKIGIREDMPRGFLAQLAWPFRSRRN